jgi:hypothetical protein
MLFKLVSILLLAFDKLWTQMSVLYCNWFRSQLINTGALLHFVLTVCKYRDIRFRYD